jgi:hypothetical protein
MSLPIPAPQPSATLYATGTPHLSFLGPSDPLDPLSVETVGHSTQTTPWPKAKTPARAPAAAKDDNHHRG